MERRLYPIHDLELLIRHESGQHHIMHHNPTILYKYLVSYTTIYNGAPCHCCHLPQKWTVSNTGWISARILHCCRRSVGCVFPLTTPCCDGVCFYTEPHFVFGHLINSYKPKSQLLTICAIFRISCPIQSILANEVAKYVLSKPDHFDGQPKKRVPNCVLCNSMCGQGTKISPSTITHPSTSVNGQICK